MTGDFHGQLSLAKYRNRTVYLRVAQTSKILILGSGFIKPSSSQFVPITTTLLPFTHDYVALTQSHVEPETCNAFRKVSTLRPGREVVHASCTMQCSRIDPHYMKIFSYLPIR